MEYSPRKKLQKGRIEFAISKLSEINIDVHYQDKTTIKFYFKGNEITFYPYTGWVTGKGIKDGRGIANLLKQLK